MAGAAAAGTWSAPGPAWWSGLAVPRASGFPGPPGPDAVVPVSGPAARDTDDDGVPDTVLAVGHGTSSLWTDLDGDGLADRVTVVGAPQRNPGTGPPDLEWIGAVLRRLAGP